MTTHNDVAHAWAHNMNRAYKGPSMFRGHASGYGSPKADYDTIFSYGYHFPIARHVKSAKGTPCILMTTKSYSVTTAKHISYVARALPSGVLVFNVDNVLAGTKDKHKENYLQMKKAIDDCLKQAVKARKYTGLHLSEADSIRREMNAYTNLFKLGFRKVDGAWGGDTLEAVREQVKAQKAKQDKADKAAIKKWLAFETDTAPHTRQPYVRVHKERGEVQTSYGVRVPLRRAKALYRLSCICKAKGRAYTPRKGQKIDHWAIDNISAQGTLKIGCHALTLPIQRMAARMAGLA